MDKKSLRSHILKLRDAIDEADRFRFDGVILQQLLAQKEYRDANTIFTFVNYKSEVDTKMLIQESLRRGKRVIVPIVDKENRVMILSEIRSIDELVKSDMGILEPGKDYVRVVDPKSIDLCIVPGSVFDKSGNRIGYGGGFYDKMIPLFRKDAKTIGIGYELQLVDDIPIEEFDVKINKLITEEQVYEF